MRTSHLLRLLYAGTAGVLLVLATLSLYVMRTQRSADTAHASFTAATQQVPTDSLVELGQQLWKENVCGACHAGNMLYHMTAPALAGVSDRWADYPREDLYAWVRNSQRLIGEGHPRAREIWAEWQPTVMNNFGHLTDSDVEALLRYIDATAQR